MSRPRIALVVVAAVLVGALAVAGWIAVIASVRHHADGRGHTEVHRITVDHLRRSYRLRIPGDTDGPRPLVVVLHGGLGTAAKAEHDFGWDVVADREHVLVAYPEGVGRTWNGGGCCGQAQREHVDDVGFVQRVVAQVRRDHAVDPKRIYVTGISNGGMLTYALVCDTRLFAAAAPVATTQLVDCPDPAPVSLLQVHGRADPFVPYDGRPGAGPAYVDGPPIPELNATWRRQLGCDPPTSSTKDGVTTLTADCPQGRSVELVTHAAGHIWPPGAAAWIWAFFAAHPKP